MTEWFTHKYTYNICGYCMYQVWWIHGNCRILGNNIIGRKLHETFKTLSKHCALLGAIYKTNELVMIPTGISFNVICDQQATHRLVPAPLIYQNTLDALIPRQGFDTCPETETRSDQLARSQNSQRKETAHPSVRPQKHTNIQLWLWMPWYAMMLKKAEREAHKRMSVYQRCTFWRRDSSSSEESASNLVILSILQPLMKSGWWKPSKGEPTTWVRDACYGSNMQQKNLAPRQLWWNLHRYRSHPARQSTNRPGSALSWSAGNVEAQQQETGGPWVTD